MCYISSWTQASVEVGDDEASAEVVTVGSCSDDCVAPPSKEVEGVPAVDVKGMSETQLNLFSQAYVCYTH